MSAYTARRLLQTAVMVPGLAIVTFLLIHLAPGDPIVALAGEYGDSAYYESMRARFGLDRPVGEQLLIYLANLARGDLGVSYTYGQPVVQVILARLPATLLLMMTALILSTVVGVGLGLLAARHPNTLGDFGINLFCLLGHAVPVFWLAQMMILLFALQFELLPVQGMTSAREQHTGIAYVLDVMKHMALPVAALTLQQLALVTRLTRTNLVEILSEDYVRTARAKGVAAWAVLGRHALPNAWLPVLTVIGGRVGYLLTGAVLTETVFAWPGLGRLMMSATFSRDIPLLMGIFLFVAITIMLANLLTDLAYTRFDPRIQYR